MALPQSGGGYQVGDGNLNEVTLANQQYPVQTSGVSVTLTVAQVTGGTLVAGNGLTAAIAYTTPTGAQLDAAIPNATKVGQSFELVIINLGTSSAAITLTGNTGVTIVGLNTMAVSTSAFFEWVKTGDGTWTLYRQS
jgi:hypothetical protein